MPPGAETSRTRAPHRSARDNTAAPPCAGSEARPLLAAAGDAGGGGSSTCCALTATGACIPQQKMAGLSPVLQPHRDAGSRLGYTMFPSSECESEAELSLSLARTKTRSYGSTASVTAPWAERYIEHPVSPGDTLQGIALKYGVTMEQVKRANKLFSTDCIFLRQSLNIPVILEKPSLFNGLNLLDSPENDCPEDSGALVEEEVSPPANRTSPPTSPVSGRPVVTQDEELSAKDFLQRLDLQIKRSTQAAKRLKEEEYLRHEEDDSYATSSYQH